MNKYVLRFKYYADVQKTPNVDITDIFSNALVALVIANQDENVAYTASQKFSVTEIDGIRLYEGLGIYETDNHISDEQQAESLILQAFLQVTKADVVVDMGVFAVPRPNAVPEIVMSVRDRSLEHAQR